MKITRVYTRTGDQGKTSLVGGVRISKSDPRLEAYGTVDELSAQLGMLACMLGEHPERTTVVRVQNNLFNVCTHLATDQSQTPLYPSAHLADGEIAFLEECIDTLMKQLPERQGFVLPGGTRLSAQADRCRTITRRAERRVVTLSRTAHVEPLVLEYLNRLSDFFFVFARFNNIHNQVAEIYWDKDA